MIPSPWQFVILALASYRIWRLIAEDDPPPLPEWRNRLVGAQETAGVWTFRRPTLAHMIQCPFCSGFHIAWIVTVCWWIQPHWTLDAALPFALSAALVAVKTHAVERD